MLEKTLDRIARERPLLKKAAVSYAWTRRRRSRSLHPAIRVLLPPVQRSLIDLIGGIEALALRRSTSVWQSVETRIRSAEHGIIDALWFLKTNRPDTRHMPKVSMPDSSNPTKRKPR